MNGEIEWPREIWMAEREDHDQGVVSAVMSEHATVARFEGDTERDREFHRYVDVDIYETAERYWRARVAAAYEAAAREVDCGCKCRDAVLAAETKAERWNACANATCAAMAARDIRALTPDDAKAALEAVIEASTRKAYAEGFEQGRATVEQEHAILALIDKETTK